MNHPRLSSAAIRSLAGAMIGAAAAGLLNACASDGPPATTPVRDEQRLREEELGKLASRAAQQDATPDQRAAAAPPPIGVPDDLTRPIAPDALAKANVTLDELLEAAAVARTASNATSDPAPPARDPAPPRGPEQPLDVDSDKLEAVRAYVIGRSQRLAGNADAAERNLKEAARLDPSSAATWRELGEVMLAQGNRSGAASALRRAIDLDPRDLRALDLQSRIELDRREYESAQELLTRLLALSPERLDPALPHVAGARLGMALLQTGRLRAGAQALEQALDLPDGFGATTTYQVELGQFYRQRGDLWRDIGDAYLRLGEGQRASDAYAAATRLPNLNPGSLLTRRVYATMRAGQSARAAMLLRDQLEGAAGAADELTVALIRHVSAHSEVGPALAAELAQVADAMVPAPSIAVRASLVRARAAALPDTDAAALLRQHLRQSPADTGALRDLLSRRANQGPAARIAEAIALIDAAPYHEARFASAVAGGQAPDWQALLDATAAHPDAASDAGRLFTARLRALSGDLAGAERDLAELAQDRPNYIPARVARSSALVRLGRTDDARSMIDAIPSPDDPEARVARAIVLAELGDNEEALAQLEPLVQAGAPSPTPEHLLLAAKLQSQQGRFDRAEALLRRTLELDPSRDEAFATLVALYSRGGPLPSDEKLLAVIRLVREADPSSPTLRWLRAQEAASRRQFDLAKRDLLDLAEEHPERGQLIEPLVRVWKALAGTPEIEAWLRAKSAAFPDVPAYTIELSALLDETKRTPEALELLESRLASRPGDDATSRRLEFMLRRDPATRDRADALAAARLARGPRTPETMLERAELALARGGVDEAGDALTSALELAPTLSPAAANRAARLAADIARRVLQSEAEVAQALHLARATLSVAPDASRELWIMTIYLMTRSGAPADDLIALADQAGARHEQIRVQVYAAMLEEMTRQRSQGGRRAERAQDVTRVLEHACTTIRPAPVELQVFWITRGVQLAFDGNPDTLANALASVREAGNLDEVTPKLNQAVTSADTDTANDELLQQIAGLLSQTAHGELIEWLFRQSLRLNPDNVMSGNNLGYRLLVEDRDVAQAAAMIEHAYVVMHRDPNIPEEASVTDSLGWARYKVGIILDERAPDGKILLALEGSREGLDERRLGGVELFLGDGGGADLLEFLHGELGGEGDGLVLGEGAHAEGAGVVDAGRVVRSDAVGQPLVGADALHKPAGEAAGAEDLVHDLDRDEVRVIALDAALEDGELALRDVLLDAVEPGGEGVGGVDGVGDGVALVPAAHRGFELREHLGFFEVPRDADDEVPGMVDALVELAQVIEGHAVDHGLGGLTPFGVGVAPHEARRFFAEDVVGVVVALLHPLDQLVLVELELVLREGGGLDHVHVEGEGLVEVAVERVHRPRGDRRGEELDLLVELLGRHLGGPAATHHRGGRVRQTPLAVGLEVLGVLEREVHRCQRELLRRHHVHRHAVRQRPAELRRLGRLEVERLERDLLRAGGEVGESERRGGDRRRQRQDHSRVHGVLHVVVRWFNG